MKHSNSIQFIAFSIAAVGIYATTSHGDVVLDGILGAEEWAGAWDFAENEGQRIRVLSKGEQLFVGGESGTGSILTVFVYEENSVRVLHASYAAGEGGYERSAGAVFSRTHDFKSWDRPSDAATHGAHLHEHGWSASTIEQGERGHMELMLDMSEFEEGARIAISLAIEPEFEQTLVAPAGLKDGTSQGEVQRGPLPERVRFDTTRWVVIEEWNNAHDDIDR